jgi:SPP1 gp7 family putative phage head morphogenesis protein
MNVPVTFTEALAHARSRGVVLPAVYYGELQGLARSMAFSIAGITALDQLEMARDSLADATGSGETFSAWKRRVAAGEVKLDLPAHRLENIFRTNIQGNYASGRCRSQKDTAKAFPYLMYSAINDSRTRPAHAAMDGYIARIDDPIWTTWHTPNGYNCRCTMIQLSEKEAQSRADKPFPGDQPDPGWDYSVCEEPTEGIRRAIESRVTTCRDDLNLAAKATKPLYCHPQAASLLQTLADNIAHGIPAHVMVQTALGIARYEALAREASMAAASLGLPIEEAVAIRSYTDYKISRTLNRILWFVEGRSIKLPKDADKFTPVLGAILSGLDRLPNNGDVLIRGIDISRLPQGFIAAHHPGELVRYYGITSASAPGGIPMSGDITLYINQTGGRLIEPLSLFPEQREVLIRPGTLFEVVGFSNNTIRLLQVDEASAVGRVVHEFRGAPA